MIAAAWAAIGWGVETGSKLIKKRRAKRKPGVEEVIEYEYSGNSNSNTLGGPKPIAYGLSRLSSYELATSGADTKIGLYMVSSGEILGPIAGAGIDTVMCDDVPASSYGGVSGHEFRAGAAGDARSSFRFRR